MRVEIPAYTDRWMMGDRYGDVLDMRQDKLRADRPRRDTVARVKLDKSGKTIKVYLDDCRIL